MPRGFILVMDSFGIGAAPGAPPSQYPLLLPAAPPSLAPGDLLLLVGPAVDTWTVSTLEPSPQVPRAVAGTEAGPWFILSAGPDPVANPVNHEATSAPPARALAAGDLPAGRYVLAAPDTARALLFDTTRP